MANVQPENGFTRIAHEILEQTMKIKLSPTQHKIILAVWRYTYGFNRKDHEMSLSFFSEATDVHKQRIKPELDKLIDRQILIVIQENTARKSRRISFNKDYDKWDKPESAKMLTVSESAYSRVSETDDSRVSRTAYQERKNLKINIKKDAYEMHLNPFKEYEKNFGLLSSSVINKFNYWLDDSQFVNPEEIICEVITRAKEKEAKHPMQYIDKILLDHYKNNRLTLDAVKANHEEFDKKMSSKKQKSKSLDWELLKKELDDE